MTNDKYEWTPERRADLWADVTIARASHAATNTLEQRKTAERERIAAEAKVEKDGRKALRQLKREAGR